MSADHCDIRLLAQQVRGAKIQRLIKADRLRRSTVFWGGDQYTNAVCLPWFLYACVFAVIDVEGTTTSAPLERRYACGHMYSGRDRNIFAVMDYRGYQAVYKRHPWKLE